jgi:hypothetical protein
MSCLIKELKATSIPPKIAAKTSTKIQTMMVEPTNSSREGHVIFLSSALTSLKKLKILFIVLSPYHARLLLCGRPGGIRTPNPRIWSPPLYQLELLAFLFILFSFFMSGMLATLATVFIQCEFAKLTLF